MQGKIPCGRAVPGRMRGTLVGTVLVVEPSAGGVSSPFNEFVGSAEVGRRDGERAHGWGDMETGAAGIPLHLVNQLAVQEQRECGERDSQRALRWVGSTGISGRQEIDVVDAALVGEGE